jgi:hypothetical protein
LPPSGLAKVARLRYQALQMSRRGPLLTDPRYLELKDRFAGLLVLVAAMAACVCLSFWAKERARPESVLRASPATLRGIVGWPHAVDALGTLEAARRSSRPRDLRQIVLDGVKSDGTIDIVTGPGALTYLFHNGARKPKLLKLPETGAAGSPPVVVEKPPQCPRQVIRIREDGIDPQAELKDHRCPAVMSEPLPNPVCGPREIWSKALAKGASIRQLAHMEYYLSKAGPAWKMTLPGGRFQLALSGDCQRELNRADASSL